MNIINRINYLLSNNPNVQIATITELRNDGKYNASTIGGVNIILSGGTYAVDDVVYYNANTQDNVITGKAPSVTYVEISV